MSYDNKTHPLTININLLGKHGNVWQNPNDPDDENEHFKQPLIAIELEGFMTESIDRTVDLNSHLQWS